MTSANARGYNYRWQKYRLVFLRNNPLCVFCKQRGLITEANVVDHIIPHEGDYKLFWDKSNHQALCKPCHDRYKKSIETGSAIKGSDINGLPLDPTSHWLK